MRFFIDEVEVFFPYESCYPEQYNYMVSLKQSLDAKGHCLLEMPTGTGKTVSLLSLITSYQIAHPKSTGKLLYCTRTVPEMTAAVKELKKVVAYQEEYFPKKRVTGVCLSSRRNMCIHEDVMRTDANSVDTECRRRTAPWNSGGSSSRCNFF